MPIWHIKRQSFKVPIWRLKKAEGSIREKNMKKELAVFNQEDVRSKIYTIRGLQVMIDSDLAVLYEVPTKALNQAVKRNIERFPPDFIFQLTEDEKNELVTNCDHLQKLKYSPQLPSVFTEHGIITLSGVLKSKRAIEVNIQIMRAFVEMRRFISANAQMFHRLGNVEKKQIEYDKKFVQVFDAIESKEIKPEKGIFFDGQIFDSYKFIADVIRSAEKSITLIDNYVDDSVLTLFNKRKKDVSVTIFTKEISKQLSLDLKKYNSQYKPIKIIEFKNSHDRFIIIDNNQVYHFGASLKDLGKKWFAFSKFDKEAFKLLDKLNKIR